MDKSSRHFDVRVQQADASVDQDGGRIQFVGYHRISDKRVTESFQFHLSLTQLIDFRNAINKAIEIEARILNQMRKATASGKHEDFRLLLSDANESIAESDGQTE